MKRRVHATGGVIAAVLALAMGAIPGVARMQDPMTARRWFFLHTQLVAPGGVDNACAVLNKAADLGYNGAVLTEGSLGVGGEPTAVDRERFGKLLDVAQRRGIEIVPSVMAPATILRQNPDLVEPLPVRDALFRVQGDLAVLAPDPAAKLVNGGFEQGDGGGPAGWSVQPPAAPALSLDPTGGRSGAQAIRIDGEDGAPVTVSLAQRVAVQPFRQYLLSVWARTANCPTPSALQGWIVGDGNQPLSYPRWTLARDGDWTCYRAVFNSLGNAQAQVRITTTRFAGALWLDDADLSEIGLLNMVRRDGCPLIVRGDDGTVYSEGQDFQPVRDPLMGRTPYAGVYSSYHSIPDGIRLTPGSRIQAGAALRVSYYACPVIYGRRVTQCLSHPDIDAIMRREIRRVRDLLHPKTVLISHDEMRVAGWCALCAGSGKSSGQLLADNIARCIQIIKDEAPEAAVAVWSDMFDPNHNARNPYYFARGGMAQSWNGLPSQALVLNWNWANRSKSLEWFSSRGNPQIIAGYYDRPVAQIRDWLQDARGIGGVEGVMYTTWKRDYDNLDAFARAAWAR